jgi:hypothetical protein
MNDFEAQIGNLDLSLFARITSQSTDEDKTSLLACQLAVRELQPEYNYLEIGSYLGGSIQPYLIDDRCKVIYSIDKRPRVQPDERGFNWTYENNSTDRMLANLREISEEGARKVIAIDGDTKILKAAEIPEKIDLCLIDGEHTDEAVVSDFEYCLERLSGRGSIIFHDAHITYNGIWDCIESLKKRSIKFNAYALPHIVFVVEIGDFPIHRHPAIQQKLINGYSGYLFSLKENDRYRRFANRAPFRLVRNLYFKLRKGNTSY